MSKPAAPPKGRDHDCKFELNAVACNIVVGHAEHAEHRSAQNGVDEEIEQTKRDGRNAPLVETPRPDLLRERLPGKLDGDHCHAKQNGYH